VATIYSVVERRDQPEHRGEVEFHWEEAPALRRAARFNECRTGFSALRYEVETVDEESPARAPLPHRPRWDQDATGPRCPCCI